MGYPESLYRTATVDPVSGARSGDIFPGARGNCLEDSLDGVKVQLGCGHKPWPGWINVDGERARKHADVVADLKSIPLETGSVDLAIAVHVIEHFYQWEVQDVLTEWKRILKPGGILILELPSMTKVLLYIKQCIEQKQPYWMQMSWWAIYGDPRYQDPSMCHKWGYTEPEAKFVVEQAGFEHVSVMEPRYHVKKRDMRVVGIKPKEQPCQ